MPTVVLPLTEAEFLTIAEKMKAHSKRRMKMEPFPWLRDYHVEMDKLYTELTLEQVHKTVSDEPFRTIMNYENIFEHDSQPKNDCSEGKEYTSERKKILLKGRPGMGKTTL